MAEQEWPVTNLILLGRAGNGKSSTGNTIIDQKYFEVNFLGEDMDQRCKMFRAVIKDGPIINVIDTPGLLESSVSGDYLSKEIMNCLTMAEEGIHAVLFVLSITNRISQREEFTFNILQHIFDDKILDYFIVVFTGRDELEADNQTLDDYLREGCPEFLTRVLKLCGGRKVLFNNKTKDKGKRTKQLKQLLAHVTDIRKQNGGIPYTENMHRKIKILTPKPLSHFEGTPRAASTIDVSELELIGIETTDLEE
ncbi:immune-associated nucleotide-binding protein 1 [Arabidopsis lyrata subsp. lyrata]|uniref:immune-associated nucleotide-binding protein 1 n=1 Tax=Arabidopsis lyrata subsp. lyrata TaxID=81972 RepID=UPI000A29C7B5|nr:immune-associated nucleotide-binding protein 1 [Arabidopsis lyrata subsp. lyrata]|eukprot:XP_002893789.2 immune-associated nucleotide-binding protein 1 [Arabidopsis lyrata subsp. lyrata]